MMQHSLPDGGIWQKKFRLSSLTVSLLTVAYTRPSDLLDSDLLDNDGSDFGDHDDPARNFLSFTVIHQWSIGFIPTPQGIQ